MSKREDIFTALFERLKALDIPVCRNEILPHKIPPEGMIFLRDGNMGEPEVLLSPPLYIYQHTIELEVIVQNSEAIKRDIDLDKVLLKISNLFKDDKTLGGMVDYLRFGVPDFILEAVEGASAFKAAVIPLVLEYALENPLN